MSVELQPLLPYRSCGRNGRAWGRNLADLTTLARGDSHRMSDLAMGTHLTHHGPWRPRPVGSSGSRWANKALLLHVARSHAPRAAVGTLRPLHPVEPVMLRRQGSLLWSARTATLQFQWITWSADTLKLSLLQYLIQFQMGVHSVFA